MTTTGKIVSPDIREVMPGRSVMRFGLKTPEGILSCVAHGGTAQGIARDTHEGDMVWVILRPTHRSFRVGGERRVMTENIVTDYKVLTPTP
jgi:hypothetical protein